MNVAPHCSNTHPELIDHLDQQIIEFNRSRDLDDTALPLPFLRVESGGYPVSEQIVT